MAARTELEDTQKQIVCKPANMKAPQMNSWNDDRLNELSTRTDEGFREVKGEIKEVRQEMREGFAQVDQEFKAVRQETKAGFTRVDDQLLRLSHILIVGGSGLIAALVGVIASILLAVIFG